MVKDIKVFLLDMDGTIYLENRLLDGAKEFFDLLEERKIPYLFLTNNSSKSKKDYTKKLRNMGLDVTDDDIFTSGEGTILYMKKNYPDAKRIFLLGTPSLEREFRDAGYDVVNDTLEDVDELVLGFDTTLTYDKLHLACDFVREKGYYTATHPDFNCPLDGGKFKPDIGCMIDFIAASTGIRPAVIGKPSRFIIESILDKHGFRKEETAMVGDRLYTDIKTGENAGILSILVYTGETTPEMYENSDIRADLVFDSIKDIAEEMKKK